MTESANQPTRLTRREALQGAIALVGGSIAASQLAPLASALAEGRQAAPRFLSDELFAVLERTADLVIPETDTQGALGARVHYFIDGMLADWANESSREILTRAIRQIDDAARRHHDSAFVTLDAGQQFALLEAIDRDAYDRTDADVPFRKLKELILLGYYSSEVGASVELRFNPIPGPSIGCVPLVDIGRAWYKHGGF